MTFFSRAHGLGNDYLVMELPPGTPLPAPSAIRLLCHRQFGIGADGLLLKVPARQAPFAVRIFNPDGSEAEKSGNGLRIFARYLYDAGLLEDQTEIETRGGLVRARVIPRPENSPLLSVDMGPAHILAPRNGSSPLPGAAPGPERLPGLEAAPPGLSLRIGNPHRVMFVDDLSTVDLPLLGPQIEVHPWFPDRTNVQVATVLDSSRVRIRIWERGAGLTLASGSSACAVVAAGIHLGLLQSPVTVEMPGGELHVEQDSLGHLHQCGPVTVLCTGTLAPDLRRELQL